MAKVALALLRHNGSIKQQELLAEIGIPSGVPLRRTNGALNKRVQAASEGADPGIPDGRGTYSNQWADRPHFLGESEILRFIRDNQFRFSRIIRA